MGKEDLAFLNRDYEEKYGFNVETPTVFRLDQGLHQGVVQKISELKKEPAWMALARQKALDIFFKKTMPVWGGDLSKIDFDKVTYFLKSSENVENDWEKVPAEIKKTFERLGIPEAERKFLAGAGAQFESEGVYHKLRDDLMKQGVIFCDMDTAVREHPALVQEYFGRVVPAADNKFAALNTACWSGGSFIYVPKGVKVNAPLQAYFRINAKNMGQFERTLIIADEGAEVTYFEGCTSPVYTTDSLHAAVVELIAKKNAKIRYVTLQNWSSNVYNLVTKRAVAEENATVEWLDANMGCLTGDTKVFLNSDVKEISKVEAGNTVFAVDEDFKLRRHKVVAKKYNGKQRVYKIKTLNQREIKATINHPFLALQKRGKFVFPAWTHLGNLREGDLLAISGDLPECGEPFQIKFEKRGIKKFIIPKETTEDTLWLLGVYMGDGYCDKNRVCFAVPEQDKSCEKLVSVLKNIFDLEGERNGVVLRIASVDFVRLMKETFGLAGKANSKRIPEWIYKLPKEQRLAFIEGYIAADGYMRKGHKNVSITSCNRMLLEDTKMLAMTCGLNPTKISTWTRKEKKPFGIEEKEYTHHFLYFGEGKFKEQIAFTQIVGIADVGEEDTWDIEVEGAHNFVANGFLVHNSKLTMKYPSVILKGPHAKADILSIAFANKGQHQDAGGKAIHLAPHTTSRIISKSISKDGGRSSYRGLIRVNKNATHVKSTVRCDALLLDDRSRSDTYPTMHIEEEDAVIAHEATVGKIGEEQVFYLMARGLTESEAMSMIVLGFISDFVKELPVEYAVEFNKLIQLEMENAVG